MEFIKNKMARVMLGLACTIGGVTVANATIVYDGNATYLIDHGVNDNLYIDNTQARVVIDSGGRVQGLDATAPGSSATTVRVRRGNLDVTGNGRVIAGPGQDAIDMTSSKADVRLSGRAQVHGNIFSDGTTPGWRNEATALQRLYIQDRAVVHGNVEYSGYLRIEDQAVVLGNVFNPFNGSASIDMRGGVVAGNVTLGSLNDYVFNMSGGAILGRAGGGAAYMDLNITGGYIGQGFHTRANITGDIRGGQIDGGVSLLQDSIQSSELAITGGQFNTYDGEWLLAFVDSRSHGGSTGELSTLDIAGGQFGYRNAGLGFFIDEYVNFNIWGRELVYSGGWLTGYLQDGSWFSNALTFGDNWHGSLVIHNVPEPGSLGLLATCLLGAALTRRRRAADVG
jgi:hypothetical protein